MRPFFVTAFLLLSCLCHAQYDFSAVDAWLQRNAPQMGGRAVLVVYRDGKIVYTGSANETSGRQKRVAQFIARRRGQEAETGDYTPETKQMIASCSKWLSAALVMTFVDEGKLRLTDTIGRWLPSLSRSGKGGITIAQCLSHTTGIRAPDLRESLQEMQGIRSMDEAVEKLAALPMEGAPGTVFRYSNAGLQLAGAVLEKISGQRFADLFAVRIAAPLKMTHTDWGDKPVALPAGGARSTADDYLRFLVMILNKGTFEGKRVLSEGSVAAMQVNRITSAVRVAYAPAEAGNFGYGFGEWVMETASTTNATKAVTSPGLFGSFPLVDNDKKYCAFLMTFYLKSAGRNARYKELKKLLDEAMK
ncbi:serine hydrolase domain-containing protein [Flaviaesturariibacter terrae]